MHPKSRVSKLYLRADSLKIKLGIFHDPILMLSVEESKPFTYRINHFRCCVHRSVFSYVPCPSVYCGHLHVYSDTQSRSSSGRILPVPRIRPKIETEDCVLHLLSSRSYKASLLNVTTVAKFGQVHFYNLYIVTSIALGEILCI